MFVCVCVATIASTQLLSNKHEWQDSDVKYLGVTLGKSFLPQSAIERKGWHHNQCRLCLQFLLVITHDKRAQQRKQILPLAVPYMESHGMLEIKGRHNSHKMRSKNYKSHLTFQQNPQILLSETENCQYKSLPPPVVSKKNMSTRGFFPVWWSKVKRITLYLGILFILNNIYSLYNDFILLE